jgi:hypothetical protein
MVLNFTRLAHQNPVDASDEKLIDALFAAAIDDMSDGYVTQAAPVAPWRAEARTLLPGTETNGSNRIPITFPWPVLIVGMRPVAQPFRPIGAGLAIPSLDDIEVANDINNVTQLNTSQGTTGAVANNVGTSFITLGAIGVQTPVLWGAALKDPRPDLGFTFRWTQPPTGSPIVPIFTDTFVKVTVYYLPLFPQESANVAPSLRGHP